MIDKIVRGPLLVPRDGGNVRCYQDGAIAIDSGGTIAFAGDWSELYPKLPADGPVVRPSEGVMLPPLLDVHTHIPQHPIRGGFLAGVEDQCPHGRLLAGLQRNVFPAEAKCSERRYARGVIEDFAADALAHGVAGGAAYMTVSAKATEMALEILPETWSVGLVLMNQNCPGDLRTDEDALASDVERLAGRFGRRLIITDRFAVSTSSELRRKGSALAGRFHLGTQTHLNEQTAEKRLVERELYPGNQSYTDVYLKDGLLDYGCILAHCIHMTAQEWKIVADSGSAIAHCPTSNQLLESGVMELDEVIERRIPYAIGTDVGASPTVSMLAEMGRFLRVQWGRSGRATPSEALYRATLAPARILGMESKLGRLEEGYPASFIEVDRITAVRDEWGENAMRSADDVIRSILPADLEDPRRNVRRVTLRGKAVLSQGGGDA